MRKQWIIGFLLTCLLTGAIDVLQAQDDCTFYTKQFEQLLKDKDMIEADSLVALLRVIQALRCPHDAALINRKKENLSRLRRVTLTGNTGWATMSAKRYGALVAINGEFAITGQLKAIKEYYPVTNDLYRIQDTLEGYSLFHKSGRFITSTSYDSIWSFDENGYAGVQKDGKTGVINKEGKEIVKPEINRFSYGIAEIRIDGKFGYINKQGGIVVPAIYQRVENLNNGFALLKHDSSTYYFLDIATRESTLYNEVIFFNREIYQGVFRDRITKPLTPGTAIVALGGKYGIAADNGKLLTKLEFEKLSTADYSEERIVVHNERGQYGVIDRFGKKIASLQYAGAGSRFFEGYLNVAKADKDGSKKWGYIDVSGKEVIPFRYEDANFFSEGLASVAKDMSNGIKYGFIDKQGNEVISFKFDDTHWFSEGLCPVDLYATWGYINKKGRMVINNEYEEVSSFLSGQATVKIAGREFKIDRKGNEIK